MWIFKQHLVCDTFVLSLFSNGMKLHTLKENTADVQRRGFKFDQSKNVEITVV